MTPERKTIEQRINELESAALIADDHNPLFAHEMREHIKWLQAIQSAKKPKWDITKLRGIDEDF